MVILGIDSTNQQSSVALLKGNKVLSVKYLPEGSTQAEMLMPAIDSCLQECEFSYQSIDIIAVCIGPGNFTSVRVGISIAKALALTLNVKILPVTNMQALSTASAGNIIAVTDVKRGEVYLQYFVDGNPTSGPKLAKLSETIKEVIKPGYKMIGSAAEAVSKYVENEFLQIETTSEMVVKYALTHLEEAVKGFEVQPFYTRGADV